MQGSDRTPGARASDDAYDADRDGADPRRKPRTGRPPRGPGKEGGPADLDRCRVRRAFMITLVASDAASHCKRRLNGMAIHLDYSVLLEPSMYFSLLFEVLTCSQDTQMNVAFRSDDA